MKIEKWSFWRRDEVLKILFEMEEVWELGLWSKKFGKIDQLNRKRK